MKIDISDLDMAVVLQALHAHGRMNLLNDLPLEQIPKLKVSNCREALKAHRNNIVTLEGVPIKASFENPAQVDFYWYNIYFGDNAAERVIQNLRAVRTYLPQQQTQQRQDEETASTLDELVNSAFGQASNTARFRADKKKYGNK